MPRYSMYESKKLMWEVDVVGDENENVAEIVKAFLNRTMEVFEENSKEIMTTVTKVRHSLARARHQQYWIKSKNSKDAERLESLQGMVDTWSIVYSGLVCAVGIGQILVLSFFNIKPATSQLKMRT
ncbi:uncharacterized protein LOC111706559 isoform X2 [Eurytemora carolleeae]|uniref:uncharacterized protein LOC111706559 isoform X2 n=1 Tax=Eurytemora carolleeae TaxID=1294199 RepID=UPI000C76E4FC|nr:uncharacterized protein LOC111706559 isoform X2 [Eurytemora carolleeae]|eukprot:XP_023335222.1 uncharacterized protein LOC111706559 isoform X2 [Eurytemora affinis]